MEGMLQAGDFVGVSFWLVSVAMVAATVFFFYEGMSVKKEWKLSMTIAGLVTLVAAIHYYYMRDYWVASVIAGSPDSPIVYRYICRDIYKSRSKKTILISCIYYLVLCWYNPKL